MTTSSVYSGLGNLVKLLPTATVFLFQFLNPLFTNRGRCEAAHNKFLTGSLILICGLSCLFSTFTDSYKDSDGKRHFAIVTTRGLWPSPENIVDTANYRLKFKDLVHAFIALLVFSVLSLLDSDTVKCFYPKFEASDKLLLQVLPVFGGLTSGVFVIFPSDRHGIGHPTITTDDERKLLNEISHFI